MFGVAHTLVLYLVQEEKLQREMKSEGVGFIGLSSFLRDFKEREKEIIIIFFQVLFSRTTDGYPNVE